MLPLTGDCGWHGAPQGGDCCNGNLIMCVLLGAGMAGGHHVGFEESSLQVDVVVAEGLVHSSQDLPGDILISI